jgi:hypothetical protein
MSATIAFVRAPTSPPPSYVFLLGKVLLLNGVETDTAPRLYSVRLSRDEDHPSIADDREDALRQGYSKWARSITITRLADGRSWIFAERSTSFQNGFIDTDEHAIARLAANERYRKRLFGGAQ